MKASHALSIIFALIVLIALLVWFFTRAKEVRAEIRFTLPPKNGAQTNLCTPPVANGRTPIACDGVRTPCLWRSSVVPARRAIFARGVVLRDTQPTGAPAWPTVFFAPRAFFRRVSDNASAAAFAEAAGRLTPFPNRVA